MTDTLANAVRPFTPEPVPGGFRLALPFEGRSNDPLSPGADAIEAYGRFKRAFRECALAMAHAIDPTFQLGEGEASAEDADPSGAQGWSRYGDDAGGLLWSWGCTEHAADETMYGAWSVLGLADGAVSLAITRRTSGAYEFEAVGPERGVLDAAMALGDTLRALGAGAV
jgi:hypothetical protein